MVDFQETEWIARSHDVLVRVNTLGPGQGTPWHFHSQVADTIFCLEEGLVVAFRDPERTTALRPGQRQDVVPRQVHRVCNTSAGPLRYLLIQSGGAYDFNEVK